MRTRRSVLSDMAVSSLAAQVACLVPESVIAAGSKARIELHALLVGINTYSGRVGTRDAGTGRLRLRPIRALKGCVNDARLLEAAVRPIASSTRILLENEATRATLETAWRDTLGTARSGDTILFTFSGHGGLEPESVKGSEASGYDQAILFSSFDAERNLDRLIDDEIHELFRSAREKRVRVVFVADCCHAGTLTRAIDARVADEVPVRSVRAYDVAAELAGGVAPSARISQQELDNVVFFGGAQDHELVPEIQIDGRWHGALSVAFARALRGRAAADRDGVITGRRLMKFVQRQVRAISDSGQHPNVRWPTADARSGIGTDDVLFHARVVGADGDEARAEPVRLRVIGLPASEASALAATMRDVALTVDGVDLVWDAVSGDCLNAAGQTIATKIDRERLQGVIDRTSALRALNRLSLKDGLELRLLLATEQPDAPPSPASDAVHIRGTQLRVVVHAMRHPYVAVINLTGTGLVQRLYPLGRDPVTVVIGRPFVLPPLLVGAPFGSDHVIALAAPRPLDGLMAELGRPKTAGDPRAALAAIEALALEKDLQVGVQGLYTAPGP